jgi:hypothetical protein
MSTGIQVHHEETVKLSCKCEAVSGQGCGWDEWARVRQYTESMH